MKNVINVKVYVTRGVVTGWDADDDRVNLEIVDFDERSTECEQTGHREIEGGYCVYCDTAVS